MTVEQLGPTINPDETPIKPVSQEGEARDGIGIALLIVGIDPQKQGKDATDPLLWTIRELRSKSETDRTVGELSIPAETKKVGESKIANILGALVEFGNDQHLNYLKDHLFLINDVYAEKSIFIKGNPADMAVLIYDGSLDILFNPACDEEVSPNGWMSRSAIQQAGNIRSALKQAIELDIARGISERGIETYHTSPESRMPIFPSSMSSIKDFYIQRELLPDVHIPVVEKS